MTYFPVWCAPTLSLWVNQSEKPPFMSSKVNISLVGRTILEWKVEFESRSRTEKPDFDSAFSISWSKKLRISDFLEWNVEIWGEEIRFWLDSWSEKLNPGVESWIWVLRRKKSGFLEWKIEIWVLRRKKSDFDFEFSIPWSEKVNLGSEKKKIRTQISIFHSNSTGVKSKSDFFFSNFVYSLQEMWFFRVFTPRNRKVKSKSDFSSSQNPNFEFSLQEIWFFLLRTQIQLFTPGVKSKSDFIFSNFDFLSLQEI